ncbi:hypothetical protein [Nitrosomonas sp.]|nr:hypothetical protein [Nitrosomonas sp.]
MSPSRVNKVAYLGTTIHSYSPDVIVDIMRVPAPVRGISKDSASE